MKPPVGACPYPVESLEVEEWFCGEPAADDGPYCAAHGAGVVKLGMKTEKRTAKFFAEAGAVLRRR